MSTPRPTTIDDHGDQFPGALPPTPTTTPRPGAADQFTQMHSAYVYKVNALVSADRHDLARELAEAFPTEPSAVGARPDRTTRTSGRGTPVRRDSARPAARLGRFTRRSLDRFDRYTLDVFNAGHLRRPDSGRSER